LGAGPPGYGSAGIGVSKNLEGGVEDNLSIPSSFIANAHNGLDAYYTEKGGFLKKL